MGRVAGSGCYAAFLARLFRDLEARGIRYCVTRNFEALPDAFEGDVDLLLEPGEIRRAEAAIDALGGGFVVLRRISRNDHRQLWIGAEPFRVRLEVASVAFVIGL